ncbi:GNAT family N-acetyltransferase [Actinomycetospora sp. NBRC 106378]|uniref:GNAT family N-acetyltransferase n=1 Tax=Actinomycetospora sp. NBRC 106378 TaxID=3032208 RepID=UPI0024A1E9FD|nr:GNAT family N-acetyltransferase [Actinomycetospora sp. NBRC 106378]GLZ53739.1 N-acetyltransferase [Actinomycetospora sp. NBRC 106378]
MTDQPDVTEDTDVNDVPERHRYEIRVGGTTAGFAEYALRTDPHGDGETIAFIHTEVDDAFAGRGLAGRLARAALDDARARGLAVLPFCPFIRGWIAKHPDYVDLVPTGRREQFDLT